MPLSFQNPPLWRIRGQGGSMLPLALNSPESITAVMEQGRVFMGLKKPLTSTLKPVLCMYWTQTAQHAVQYIPTYPIYNHPSSFCMPKKALPPVTALSKLSSCHKVFYHLIPTHSSYSPSAALSLPHLIQGPLSLLLLLPQLHFPLALNPLTEPATAAPCLHRPTRRP